MELLIRLYVSSWDDLLAYKGEVFVHAYSHNVSSAHACTCTCVVYYTLYMRIYTNVACHFTKFAFNGCAQLPYVGDVNTVHGHIPWRETNQLRILSSFIMIFAHLHAVSVWVATSTKVVLTNTVNTLLAPLRGNSSKLDSELEISSILLKPFTLCININVELHDLYQICWLHVYARVCVHVSHVYSEAHLWRTIYLLFRSWLVVIIVTGISMASGWTPWFSWRWMTRLMVRMDSSWMIRCGWRIQLHYKFVIALYNKSVVDARLLNVADVCLCISCTGKNNIVIV